LIRKGTDQLPGKPEEIDQLKAQVTTVARVPIIIGDHRLSVEIVTPKTDNTLNGDKYAAIDSRITVEAAAPARTALRRRKTWRDRGSRSFPSRHEGVARVVFFECPLPHGLAEGRHSS
jgi:hypothetical protein